MGLTCSSRERSIPFGDGVALTQDPGDFARLPVDDARQDQVQATTGVHLLSQLAGVDPAAPPVKDVPGPGVELLDLEQAAPDPAAQFRLWPKTDTVVLPDLAQAGQWPHPHNG
jgi:hypothetical protein